MNFYIYALFRPDGSPFYIGRGYQNRINEHVTKRRRGRSEKDDLVCDLMDRHGDVHREKILTGLTAAEVADVERIMIDLVGRAPNGPLLNKMAGGLGGRMTHAASTKQKMSRASLGRKKSPQHVANMAAGRRGKSVSAEAKANMSAGQKRRVRTPEELARMSVMARGRTFTPEWRAKLSDAAKRRYAK